MIFSNASMMFFSISWCVLIFCLTLGAIKAFKNNKTFGVETIIKYTCNPSFNMPLAIIFYISVIIICSFLGCILFKLLLK